MPIILDPRYQPQGPMRPGLPPQPGQQPVVVPIHRPIVNQTPAPTGPPAGYVPPPGGGGTAAAPPNPGAPPRSRSLPGYMYDPNNPAEVAAAREWEAKKRA